MYTRTNYVSVYLSIYIKVCACVCVYVYTYISVKNCPATRCIALIEFRRTQSLLRWWKSLPSARARLKNSLKTDSGRKFQSLETDVKKQSYRIVGVVSSGLRDLIKQCLRNEVALRVLRGCRRRPGTQPASSFDQSLKKNAIKKKMRKKWTREQRSQRRESQRYSWLGSALLTRPRQGIKQQ